MHCLINFARELAHCQGTCLGTLETAVSLSAEEAQHSAASAVMLPVGGEAAAGTDAVRDPYDHTQNVAATAASCVVAQCRVISEDDDRASIPMPTAAAFTVMLGTQMMRTGAHHMPPQTGPQAGAVAPKQQTAQDQVQISCQPTSRDAVDSKSPSMSMIVNDAMASPTLQPAAMQLTELHDGLPDTSPCKQCPVNGIPPPSQLVPTGQPVPAPSPIDVITGADTMDRPSKQTRATPAGTRRSNAGLCYRVSQPMAWEDTLRRSLSLTSQERPSNARAGAPQYAQIWAQRSTATCTAAQTRSSHSALNTPRSSHIPQSSSPGVVGRQCHSPGKPTSARSPGCKITSYAASCSTNSPRSTGAHASLRTDFMQNSTCAVHSTGISSVPRACELGKQCTDVHTNAVGQSKTSGTKDTSPDTCGMSLPGTSPRMQHTLPVAGSEACRGSSASFLLQKAASMGTAAGRAVVAQQSRPPWQRPGAGISRHAQTKGNTASSSTAPSSPAKSEKEHLLKARKEAYGLRKTKVQADVNVRAPVRLSRQLEDSACMHVPAALATASAASDSQASTAAQPDGSAIGNRAEKQLAAMPGASALQPDSDVSLPDDVSAPQQCVGSTAAAEGALGPHCAEDVEFLAFEQAVRKQCALEPRITAVQQQACATAAQPGQLTLQPDAVQLQRNAAAGMKMDVTCYDAVQGSSCSNKHMQGISRRLLYENESQAAAEHTYQAHTAQSSTAGHSVTAKQLLDKNDARSSTGSLSKEQAMKLSEAILGVQARLAEIQARRHASEQRWERAAHKAVESMIAAECAMLSSQLMHRSQADMLIKAVQKQPVEDVVNEPAS